MRRKNLIFNRFIWGGLLLVALPLLARVKVSRLAEKLLFGGNISRDEAIKEFNQLSSEGQERLVPDFMVALSDDDPEVRKTAARILKSMGVKTSSQIRDAKKELMVPSTVAATADKWGEEKKMRAAENDKWSDLTKMREEEKKGHVTLDAGQLRSDEGSPTNAFSAVIDSLKDPDPWVRAQAARRLGMIQPAPTAAIPTLIKMLGDKEVESRRAAVAALGSFGHLAQEAIIPLNAALSDPDPAVRTLAGDALKQIQQPR